MNDRNYLVAVAVLSLALAASIAVLGQERPSKGDRGSCDATCTFIKDVLREEKNGFAKFRGEDTTEKKDGTGFAANNPPSQDARCTVTQFNKTPWMYQCHFGHRPGESDAAFPFRNASVARARYAELVGSLRSALSKGWEFEEETPADNFMGTTHTTTATQSSTGVKVTVEIFWLGGEQRSTDTDAAADISLSFEHGKKPKPTGDVK